MTAGSFYESVINFEAAGGDGSSGTFIATEHTASPWDSAHQHAGPPSALMLRAAEQLTVPGEQPLSNCVSLDIIAPIPVGAVTVTSRVIKRGRLTSLVESRLTTPASENPIMRLTAWRTRRSSKPVSDRLGQYRHAPKEGTDAVRPEQWLPGYADAMDWRLSKGTLGDGRSTVWGRPRIPLVDDDPARGVERTLLLADSASGVSALADPRRLLFVNTDLSVRVLREPVGEWLWMRAESFIDPAGIGLATSRIGDEQGSLGVGNQSLFVAGGDETSVSVPGQS